MIRSKLLTAGIACLLVTAPALANDIYKYVDENGTVHYVDRPTGAATEERVAFVSQRSSGAPRSSESGPDWRERREARQEAQKAADEEASQDAERAKLCQESRDRLQQYNQARRLYRNDENGERVYLDEKEIEEARNKVAELIEENCNG